MFKDTVIEIGNNERSFEPFFFQHIVQNLGLIHVNKHFKGLEACAMQDGLRAAVCGRHISLFRHLQHFGTIRQQYEYRKQAQYLMTDIPERLEVPNDADNANALA